RAKEYVCAGAATIRRPMHDGRSHGACEAELVNHRRTAEQFDGVAIRDEGRGDTARTYVGKVELGGSEACCADIHPGNHAIGLEALPRRGVAEQKRAAARKKRVRKRASYMGVALNEASQRAALHIESRAGSDLRSIAHVNVAVDRQLAAR